MARHSCLFRRRWPTSTDPRRTEPEVLHPAWSRSSAITTRAESAISNVSPAADVAQSPGGL